MASDARDILGLGDAAFKSKKELYKKSSNKKRKRPEGMSLEVYGLLSTSNQDPNSLVPTNFSNGGYKERARLSGKKTREWKLSEFENLARTDGLKLSHWAVKENDVDGNKKYPFADFNQNVPFPTYSDSEYNSLKSDCWSRDETDYMMELCRRFDCRFILVSDRYEYQEYGKVRDRSVEDIKERFYQIAAPTINNKNDVKTPYVYDGDHERRRKQQLDMYLRRTRKEVEELQKLHEDQKRCEQKKREKERKDAINHKQIERLATPSHDSPPATPSPHATHTSSKAEVQKYKKGRKCSGGRVGREGTPPFDSDESVPSPSTLAIMQNNKAPDFGLRFPELKAGIHLQSGRMILPASITKKRDGIISHALKEFTIEPHPIATASITDEFNRLRSDILKLHDTQSAIQHCEVEILAHIARYEQLYPNDPLPPGVESIEYPGGQTKRKLSPTRSIPEKKKKEIKL